MLFDIYSSLEVLINITINHIYYSILIRFLGSLLSIYNKIYYMKISSSFIMLLVGNYKFYFLIFSNNS